MPRLCECRPHRGGALSLRARARGHPGRATHVERVRQGGHDIPEERIRERYVQSRLNLIRLLPRLTELLVFDNSVEADPQAGAVPVPKLLLHVVRRKVRETCKLKDVPVWAKPILATALRVKSGGHLER